MERAVVEAARFLAARAGERVALGDAADHVGYSPFHLARSFERQLGVPPGQFLTAHRFQLAKQLLLDSDERVVDVCHETGFRSLGTFTSRFSAAVGSTPAAFRRLPHLLSDHPARPVVRPGRWRAGGVVAGNVRLTPAALAVLGHAAVVYVGLFPHHRAAGAPVSGALLAEPGPFALTGVPPGRYWLLASALPARADVRSQLLPPRSVVGAAAAVVDSGARPPHLQIDVDLDAVADWSTPVLVALPRLASPSPQDWRTRP